MCLLEKVSSATGYALFWDRQLSPPWQSHNLPATRHTLVCHQKRYFTRETRHDGVTHCRIWTFYHCICLTRCKNIFYGDIGCDKSMFKPAKNAPATAVRNDGDQRLLILTSNKVKTKKSESWKIFLQRRTMLGPSAPLAVAHIVALVELQVLQVDLRSSSPPPSSSSSCLTPSSSSLLTHPTSSTRNQPNPPPTVCSA